MTAGGGAVDGATSAVATTNSNGRASVVWTLGPTSGLDNNAVEASFLGLASETAGFRASGFVLGNPANTTVSGVVLDNQSVPVPGVTLSIKGTSATAIADVEGQFTVTNVPVGHVTLEVDSSTTTRPGVWADLEFELEALPGVDNTLPKPIYILPLDVANGKIAGGPSDVTVTIPGVERLRAHGARKFSDLPRWIFNGSRIRNGRYGRQDPDGTRGRYAAAGHRHDSATWSALRSSRTRELSQR